MDKQVAPIQYIPIALIVAIGFALRVYELTRKPLWLDEASTYLLTSAWDVSEVWTNAFTDHHAPLHFIVVWLIRFIGQSEFWLRFPSVVAGTLTIIMAYLIGREIMGTRTGLISAALLAVSPYHISYSQEARMYAFVVLFISVALYFLFRARKSRETLHWVGFGVASALAFYTHFYSLFIIVAMVVCYYIFRSSEFGIRNHKVVFPNDLAGFLIGIMSAGVLVAPIISSFLNQSGYFTSRTFNWGIPIWQIPSQTVLSFSYMSEIVSALFLFLMLAGFWYLFQRGWRWCISFSVLLILPLLSSMYLSQIIPFNVRYHMYLIVVFYILIAIPLSIWPMRVDKRFAVAGIISLIMLGSVVPLSGYYTAPLIEDWRLVSTNVARITQPGDVVAPVPGYMIYPLSYYYDNNTDGTTYAAFPLNESGFRSVERLNRTVYYIVTWDIIAADSSGYSVRYLDQNTENTRASVPGIYVLKKSVTV